MPIGALASGRIKEFARAKINLTLNVLGRRPDGYHELSSLVAFADTGDRLILDLSAPPGVRITGRFGSEISGRNIAETALALAAKAAPGLALGLITLEKRLPVASGIGGGSADAAAVLRLLQRANPTLAAHVDWKKIAAELGSDVLVCLENRAAWMTGAGEAVAPICQMPSAGAVLINTLDNVRADKTAAVFARYRTHGAGKPVSGSRLSALPAAFHDTDALTEFIAPLGNDLEAAASELNPAIGEALAALRATANCRYAAMSGAGPTCFGMFADPQAAAETLRAKHPDWWIEPVQLC